MTASVIVLLAAGGVARWIYSHQQGVGTRPGSPVVVAGAGGAVDRHTPVPPVQIDVPAARSAAPELGAIGVSRVRVQTIRPVWMRIEVDGTDDVGRVYPAGTMREFTPTRDVSIRAGDAGAVLVGVGQAAPAPMGQSGQVLTRKISVGEPRPSIPVAAANVPPTQSLPAAAPPIAAAPVVAEVLPAPGLPDAAREAQPQGPAAAAPPTSDLHAEILAKHQQWLDAYTGGDRQRLRAVTAEGYSLLDERTVAGQNGGAAPEVLDLRIDVAGVGAVLTARLRTLVEGTPNDSLLSEVWVRDNQQRWALMGVRITPVERVTPSGGSSNDLRRTGRGR